MQNFPNYYRIEKIAHVEEKAWNNEYMAKFLTIAEVAEYLNVSAGQVRTLIKNGELPAIQVGGRGQWRIEDVKLQEYIARGYDAARLKLSSKDQ